ncbi:MAG: hypothetical protein IPN13_11290 [Bacteroidetes bacterium]|nr:hypothetical protein [Bacteroidota bacterium]MBK9424058.1 hypothetical protein [Bacteroidota bacterium]
MYRITDNQIDFILDDIRARGIGMEELQNDLIDHICCIIEQKLEANGDFEQCYSETICLFFKKELREIETETKLLLNNKNYYTMKKIMIVSGIISAVLLTTGIILKFLHLPGAAVGIVTGIAGFSLIFLPLMFALKVKEKKNVNDKILAGVGAVVAILISMSVMFKLQHWPYANMMAVTSVGILLLVYLPVNLITGIRNPETKVNTIVSSILMIAGCGLFFSLARSPQGSVKYYCMNTEYFLRNEQLLKTQIQLSGSNPVSNPTNSLGRKLIDKSETLKQFIIEQETGYKSIDENFKANQSWLGETYVTQILDGRQDGEQQVSELNALITEYNAELAKISNRNNMSIENKFSQEYLNQLRVPDMLNNLIQIELKVLSNEQLASK